MKRKTWPASLAALLIVAGCGGGGGGGDDDAAPAPAPQAAITAANQDIVASAAINVFTAAGGAAVTVPTAFGAPASPMGMDKARGADTGAAAPAGGLSKRAAEQTARLLQLAAAKDGQAQLQAVSTQTQNCAAGGTATVTIDDANSNQAMDVGDRLTAVFAQCREGSTLIDGSFNMAVTSLTTGTGGSTIEVVASFSNYLTDDGEERWSVNGGASLRMSLAGSLTTVDLVVGSGGFTAGIVSASPAYSETLTLAPGLTTHETYQASSALDTMNTSGGFATSRLAGGLTLATALPVQRYAADRYPHAGQVLVSGAGGSRLRITAIDAAGVRLELDANGDGSYELTTVRQWSELL